VLKDRHRRYREANREAINEQQRQYREVNREAIKTRQRRYQEENSEAIKLYKQKYREANLEVLREKQRLYHARHRDQCLKHYGGKCAVCRESRTEYLAIDHINNNGAEHRAQIGGSGAATHRWLVKNKFPRGFQVLCTNCNVLKARRVDAPLNARRRYRLKVRRKLISMYSLYKGCAYCAETEYAKLDLDHVGGKKQAWEPKRCGDLYRQLIRYFRRPGYRILCASCNQALGRRNVTKLPQHDLKPFDQIAYDEAKQQHFNDALASLRQHTDKLCNSTSTSTAHAP